MADKGYDSNAFAANLESEECTAVITQKRNREVQMRYDKHVYKERYLIECFLGKIRDFGRTFSRSNKTAVVFMDFLSCKCTVKLAGVNYLGQQEGTLYAL